MKSLVVVGLSGSIITELEAIQGNAKRAEWTMGEQFVILCFSHCMLKPVSTLFVFFLPVVQRVSDVHVVGELFPQGSLQLTFRLDGLQSLA